MNGSRRTPHTEAALPATAIQLTQLLHTPLVNRDGYHVGRVIDVVADRCDRRDLIITGLVAGIDPPASVHADEAADASQGYGGDRLGRRSR
jgi:hypothetical protein